jgi:hypothetical protein
LQNAILKLTLTKFKKVSGAPRQRAFSFCVAHMSQPPSDLNLAALRGKITGLVAENALAMVQSAIDSVTEDGQYQAMKYLFEMVGIFPANSSAEPEGEDSLARRLLEALGLPEQADSTS